MWNHFLVYFLNRTGEKSLFPKNQTQISQKVDLISFHFLYISVFGRAKFPSNYHNFQEGAFQVSHIFPGLVLNFGSVWATVPSNLGPCMKLALNKK